MQQTLIMLQSVFRFVFHAANTYNITLIILQSVFRFGSHAANTFKSYLTGCGLSFRFPMQQTLIIITVCVESLPASRHMAMQLQHGL